MFLSERPVETIRSDRGIQLKAWGLPGRRNVQIRGFTSWIAIILWGLYPTQVLTSFTGGPSVTKVTVTGTCKSLDDGHPRSRCGRWPISNVLEYGVRDALHRPVAIRHLSRLLPDAMLISSEWGLIAPDV